MLPDLKSAGGHISLSTYTMNLMYLLSSGTTTLTNITSSLTSTDTTWCPITYIQIQTYDTSLGTWTDVSSGDSEFSVSSSTDLFINTVTARAYTDYYIAGYTAGGSLQDYWKMSLTVCGAESMSLSATAQAEGNYVVLSSVYNVTLTIDETDFNGA